MVYVQCSSIFTEISLARALSNVLRLMCVCLVVRLLGTTAVAAIFSRFTYFYFALYRLEFICLYVPVTMHIIYQSDMLVLLSRSVLYTFSQKFTNTYLSFYSVSVCLLVVDVNGYFYILKHRRNFRTCGF